MFFHMMRTVILSALFLHLSKYFIGMVVSNILRLVWYDLHYAVFPVISFPAPDDLTVFIDAHHGHPIVITDRIAVFVIFLAADRMLVYTPCLEAAVNEHL